MFNEASNFVRGVDLSLFIILGISLVFLVGITAVMIYFVIRYRRSKNPQAENIEGNFKLEIIWTVIPIILVLIMFYFGWAGFKPMRQIPSDAMVIKVTGQMWSWTFEYNNGKTSDSLVVPINKAVKLDMISRDVLHSFYIPAFRIKEDVVPGKQNLMWFKAQQEGSFDIFCAEYCGQRHSYMLSKVVVVTEEKYTKWLNDTTALASSSPGLEVLKKNACISCHSFDGSKLVGPSFKGLWGRKETVLEGSREVEITVDEKYIRNSVDNPDAQVVKGYNKGLMQSYKDKISDDELKAIIGYLKTLK